LALDVAASAGNPGAGVGATVGRVFLETQADPKSPYVQAAVQVTVRVYSAVPLSHAALQLPASDSVLVRQVGSDTVSTSERNGQTYQVVARHFLVFPQHSGHFSIPGPVLSGNVPATPRGANSQDPFSQLFGNSPFGGMLSATKPIKLNGEPIELDVQPRPAGAGANYWLPAQNVALTAKWRPEQLQARVGDPLTVTLHLQAEDLTAAQLPDLSALLAIPDGLKAYPDEPKLKDTANANGVIGEREQSIALIADRPGHFDIPELRLSWWDTRTNQARQTVLAAQRLVVESAPGSQTTAAPAISAQRTAPAPVHSATDAKSQTVDGKSAPPLSDVLASESPWKWVSLGLGFLWVVTLAAWLQGKRRAGSRPAAQSSEAVPAGLGRSAAQAGFLLACKSNDPHAARRHLLAWANAMLPGQRIIGLSALAKVFGGTVSGELLCELDRACYAGDSWNGAALGGALRKWPVEAGKAASDPAGKLAPLYR